MVKCCLNSTQAKYIITFRNIKNRVEPDQIMGNRKKTHINRLERPEPAGKIMCPEYYLDI